MLIAIFGSTSEHDSKLGNGNSTKGQYPIQANFNEEFAFSSALHSKLPLSEELTNMTVRTEKDNETDVSSSTTISVASTWASKSPSITSPSVAYDSTTPATATSSPTSSWPLPLTTTGDLASLLSALAFSVWFLLTGWLRNRPEVGNKKEEGHDDSYAPKTEGMKEQNSGYEASFLRMSVQS